MAWVCQLPSGAMSVPPAFGTKEEIIVVPLSCHSASEPLSFRHKMSLRASPLRSIGFGPGVSRTAKSHCWRGNRASENRRCRSTSQRLLLVAAHGSDQMIERDEDEFWFYPRRMASLTRSGLGSTLRAGTLQWFPSSDRSWSSIQPALRGGCSAWPRISR